MPRSLSCRGRGGESGPGPLAAFLPAAAPFPARRGPAPRAPRTQVLKFQTQVLKFQTQVLKFQTQVLKFQTQVLEFQTQVLNFQK
jgi:hypothetical protein